MPRSQIAVRKREARDDLFIARLATQAFIEFDSEPGSYTVRMAKIGQTWIAEHDGVAIGFAVVLLRSHEHAELCAIAVVESERGLGVGAALLARVEDSLARAGATELTLQTAEANLSAFALFSKRGFRTERRLARYYRGVFDACTMKKRIA